MKPFLLLAIRAEDAAADNEYDSFLSLSGLGEAELRRVRLEQRALGDVDLRDWSGILLGGGPFNYSDPEQLKTPVQRRVEADLSGLLDRVVSADFPFLGACYGIGALGRHQGADGRPALRRAGRGRRDHADPGRAAGPAARRAARGLPGLHRPQGGDQPPARPCRPAGQFGWLPGAGVPGRRQRLRDPVPPRTRRGRPVHPDRGLQARRLLRPGPGRRDQGAGHPQRRLLAAGDPARVRPAATASACPARAQAG